MLKLEVGFPGNLKVEAKIRNFSVMTDQPKSSGGDDSAPSPFEVFLASLGTCAGIYIKGFCVQRGLETENIKLIQEVNFDRKTGLIDEISMQIMVPADFPAQYHNALIKSAELCAVKRHLKESINFEIEVKNY